MKKLFVVRHAKSSWSNPDLDDIDRPLNKRGKRNAPEMGKRLAQRGVKPDILISSPAKRAYATAKRIASELAYPRDKIARDSRLYLSSVGNMLSVIRETPNDVATLMIFGHNPGITELVNRLTGSDIYNIPTCGTAEIAFDVSSWKDVSEGNGELVDFDYPKKIHNGH